MWNYKKAIKSNGHVCNDRIDGTSHHFTRTTFDDCRSDYGYARDMLGLCVAFYCQRKEELTKVRPVSIEYWYISNFSKILVKMPCISHHIHQTIPPHIIQYIELSHCSCAFMQPDGHFCSNWVHANSTRPQAYSTLSDSVASPLRVLPVWRP